LKVVHIEHALSAAAAVREAAVRILASGTLQPWSVEVLRRLWFEWWIFPAFFQASTRPSTSRSRRSPPFLLGRAGGETSGLGYFEDSKDDGRSLQRRAACSGVTVCVASDGLS